MSIQLFNYSTSILDVVSRGSETQIQVSEKSDSLTCSPYSTDVDFIFYFYHLLLAIMHPVSRSENVSNL